MDPIIGRKTWRTLEPYHGAIYFAAEAREEYAKLGIDERMVGYFASRSAAMGAVPAPVVQATFFNFDPGLVRAEHGRRVGADHARRRPRSPAHRGRSDDPALRA